MEEKSVAMEMLQEIKRSNKRWFIIAIIELFIIVSMIAGFFIYESQFEYGYDVEEKYNQSIEDIDNNSVINQDIR